MSAKDHDRKKTAHTFDEMSSFGQYNAEINIPE